MTTWGCSCGVAIKRLVELGAPHAKRMHLAGIPESNWSVADWLTHFSEEEKYLFPLFPNYVRRMLTTHHVTFRRQLRAFGRVDASLMRRHASIEDTFAARV